MWGLISVFPWAGYNSQSFVLFPFFFARKEREKKSVPQSIAPRDCGGSTLLLQGNSLWHTSQQS
jgi:hypothetical protein